MVGRLLSFWEGLFLAAMLVLESVFISHWHPVFLVEASHWSTFSLRLSALPMASTNDSASVKVLPDVGLASPVGIKENASTMDALGVLWKIFDG